MITSLVFNAKKVMLFTHRKHSGYHLVSANCKVINMKDIFLNVSFT